MGPHNAAFAVIHMILCPQNFLAAKDQGKRHGSLARSSAIDHRITYSRVAAAVIYRFIEFMPSIKPMPTIKLANLGRLRLAA
jgi:hypothetical protein